MVEQDNFSFQASLNVCKVLVQPGAKIGWMIDTTLGPTVVGSYSRIGPAVRRRLYHWDGTPTLTHRTVVLTGATSGIGRAAAAALAEAGAGLCLVGRNPGQLESTRLEVSEFGCEANTEVADLADLAQVRDVAGRIAERYVKIDVLLNNAGALFRSPRTVAGGFESTVALNLLSPYLLTEWLLPSLVAASGRVITMTSAGMYTQRFDLSSLVMSEGAYDGVVAYARAKRAPSGPHRGVATPLRETGLTSTSSTRAGPTRPGLLLGCPASFES